MPLLDQHVRGELESEFANLQDDVRLVVFTQKLECQHCATNRTLGEEVASASEKVSIEVYNFAIDKEKTSQYQIDKIPAIVVEGAKDYGIRFYGIPAGYEFTSLLEAIKMVSLGDSGLSEESREVLKKIEEPMNIQVFVTLTCPYCPTAVSLAHRLALESHFITAHMIESSEFPHLVNKYDVFGVPKMVVNEKTQFEGALPEPAFLSQVMAAVAREGETSEGTAEGARRISAKEEP